MSDDYDFGDFNFDDDDFGNESFSTEPGEPEGSRNPIAKLGGQALEGIIGTATDNQVIKTKVKDALPRTLAENWESAEELVDIADRAKNNLVNPIRKEMVGFKRNINKLTPLVKRYFGEGIGNKFSDLTQTRAEHEEIDPNTQELTSTIGGIFNEETQKRLESESKKLVLDLMDRQTEEDRFKLQMTTMHDMMSAVRRMDEYNRTVNYAFQQKSLEYDIKRFHLLKQILDVNKTVGESSVGHLQAIVHNTSLPELVKQQNSELFQQMFVEKWYGESLDNVMGMGRNMLRNFGRNIAARASSTADSIVESMRSVGDMADMVAGMSDGVEDDEDAPLDPKKAVLDMLAKQTGSGVVKKAMDGLIYEIMDATKDKEWFKDLVAQSDNVARNKNLFFKSFIEDMANQEEGWKKYLAPVFKILEEELPNSQRAMTSIGHLNSFKPTDPRQWDHAQRTSVVEIIPGWLERIHNLIAELFGRKERLAYDDKSGGFVDKDELKRGLLDRITTDEERVEAISEIDKLIDILTKRIDGVGSEERQLLREWLIREASTTTDLDIRKLLSASSYENLNTYDEDLTDRVSGAFSEAYNADTLYKVNGTSLKEREDNKHLSSMEEVFRNVNRKYSDDQEVLNESITGGRRGILRELGILKDDGEINELAILKHKLLGITPDNKEDDADKGIGNIINQIKMPPSPPPVEPIYRSPIPLPPNTPPANTPAPNTDIPSGTPPNINFTAPDWAAPISPAPLDLSGLVTSENFNSTLGEAVDQLVGIKNNTDGLTEGIKAQVTGSGKRLNPKVINRKLDDSKEVNDYLSGILTTLATMHAANIEYYQNVKEFELGRHGLSSDGIDFVKKGAKGVMGVAKLPFTVFGQAWATIKSKFEGKFLDKLILNIPKDVLISANVVYLNDKGRNHDPREKGPTNVSPAPAGARTMGDLVRSTTRSRTERYEDSDESTTENISRRKSRRNISEEVEERYNKLIKNKRIHRAKAYFERVTEDPAVLKEVVLKAWNKHVETESEPLTKEEFTVVYLRDKFGESWKARLDDIDEAGGVRSYIQNNEKLVHLREELSEKGLKETVRSNLERSSVYNSIKEKIENSRSIEEIRSIIEKSEKSSDSQRIDNSKEFISTTKESSNDSKESLSSIKESSNSIKESVEKTDTLSTIKEMIERNESLSSIKEKIRESETLSKLQDKLEKSETIKSAKERIEHNEIINRVKEQLGITNNNTERTSVRELISKSNISQRLMLGVGADSGNTFNTTYNKLVSYDRENEAKLYFAKLADDPVTLRDVVDDAWQTHLADNDDPLDKETFEKKFIEDKFGINAPKVIDTLKKSDKRAIDSQLLRNVGKVAHNAISMVSPRLASAIPNVDTAKETIAKKLKLDRNLDELSDEERKNIAARNRDEGQGSIRDLVALMGNRFKSQDKKEAEKARKVKGDTDGDGIRENSWRDILKERNEKIKTKRQQAHDFAKGEKGKSESDGKGLIGLLLAGVGTLVSALGKLTGGVAGLTGNLLKFGGTLGKEIVKGIWQVGKPLISKLVGGGVGLLKGANKVGGKVLSKAITVAAPIARKVGSKVVGVAARAIVGLAARAGLVAATAATPIGWAIGVAAAGYTAWEASSAIFAFFDRRSDIKIMEYLRHLEYGMVSGNTGYQHRNKISLRYFEGEMIGSAKVKDGMITVGKTTAEVWDEYRGDFEDSGGDENAAEFKRWYEGRFLPVLYKWMSLCYTFNDAYKATQKGGIFGGKDDLALQDMDDKLTNELKAGIARQSLQYDDLEHDPLEVMASPSTSVLCTTRRIDAETLCDKIIEHLKGKKIESTNPAAVEKAEKIEAKKKDAYQAIYKGKDESKFRYGGYTPVESPGKKPTQYTITKNKDGAYVYKLDKVNPKSIASTNYLDYIKSKEGFREKAYWDVSQYSIGYGTSTNDTNEQVGNKTISEEEAHRRLVNYTNKDREFIKEEGKHQGLTWTPKELDALTSFTYNLGRGNFQKLINNRNKEQIAEAIPLYSRADGEVVPALIKRRYEEVEMFQSGPKPKEVNTEHREVIKNNVPKGIYKPGVNPEDYNPYNQRDINPIVKTPPTPKVAQPVTVTPTKTNDVGNNTVKVDLSGIPSNEGLEKTMGETNTIAADTLNEQRRNNDNMESFMKWLADSAVPRTESVSNRSAPAPAMGGVTVMPPMRPRINTRSKYKD